MPRKALFRATLLVAETNFIPLKHLPNESSNHSGSARTATPSLVAEGNKLFQTAAITATRQKVLHHEAACLIMIERSQHLSRRLRAPLPHRDGINNHLNSAFELRLPQHKHKFVDFFTGQAAGVHGLKNIDAIVLE
jgi:hypothetical protein